MRRHKPSNRVTGRSSTTRQLSDAHEDHVTEVFSRWNARRSSNSGSVANDPVDVVSDLHVIECKATEGKSISVKLEDWLKIRKDAYGNRKPAMALRFRDPHTNKNIDLYVGELDEQFFLEKRSQGQGHYSRTDLQRD